MTVRTIKGSAVAVLSAQDVRAGMVIPEGLILYVRRAADVWWFDTPVASVQGRVGDDVNVFCRVESDFLDMARQAHAAIGANR